QREKSMHSACSMNAPCKATLNRWAAQAYIQPAPKKIARRWFVEPDAEYIGEQVKPAIFKTDNPKLKRILSGNG
ncbi:hypothetical protein JV213_07450, partial [Plesiomonas shigelloides]|uniref:excisionase n=1 Tax=Plesiomonas shigelloides TaxID=703 RepID=UPI001C054B0F